MSSTRIFSMNPKRNGEIVSVHKYTKDDVKQSIGVLKEFCGRFKHETDHAEEKENTEVMKTICSPEFLKDQTESIESINKNLVKCGLVHVR